MRRTIRNVCCLAIVLIPIGTANGLTVRLHSTNPGELPEFFYSLGSSSPLEIVLELVNETAADTPPVVFWQLRLGVGGDATAVGDIVFESVSPPDGALFGSDPGPVALSELPANELIVSDVDTSAEFSGVVVPAQSAAPIVTLTMLPSNDANGAFTLWGAAFGSEDLDHSSYWSNAQDFEPAPFDNPLAASQRIELARINIVGSPTLAGDYNSDLVVDAADYTVWRDGLGSAYSAEAYEVWKQHFGEVLSGGASSTSVPEPASAWLILIGLLPYAIYRRSQVAVACSHCS